MPRKMSLLETQEFSVGEAVTTATIMAIMCAAVMIVVIYKLFFSNKGTATVPGGWKFTWN